jgi:uncharacterized protein YmfQ (DUF2313 family)
MAGATVWGPSFWGDLWGGPLFQDTYAFEETDSSAPAENMVDSGQSLAGFVALLPPGRAWPRTIDNGPNLNGLCHGMSLEGERVLERTTDMLRARDPRFAYDLLDEFEEMLDLPDAVNAATTHAARRQVAYQRLIEQGDMSPDNLIQIGADLGYTLTIQFAMWNVWRIGEDTCEIGEGGCEIGEPWDGLTVFVDASGNDPVLEQAINRMTPAHMLVGFVYSS